MYCFAKPESCLLGCCSLGFHDELCFGAYHVDNIYLLAILFAMYEPLLLLALCFSLMHPLLACFSAYQLRYLTFLVLRLQVPHRRPLASRCYVAPKSPTSLSPVLASPPTENFPMTLIFFFCRRSCPRGPHVIDPVSASQPPT